MKNYRSNIVNQRITFTVAPHGSGLSGDLLLKGKDNLGNPVEFYLGDFDGTNGTFKVDRMIGYISPKATSLTLTPYYADYNDLSSEQSTDTKKGSESVKITGSKKSQTYAVSESAKQAAKDTESEETESTEIKAHSQNTDTAQEISISDYKAIGKTFTITI